MKALFDEIRSRLEGDVSAAAIGDTLTKVQVEIVRQREAKARHEAKTIDLLADHSDVMAADRAFAEAMLNERRLAEAERQLRARQASRREAEVEAARAEGYRKAKAIRDEAVADISRAWAAHASGLVALVQRIEDVNAEIRSACDKPPAGFDPIGGVIDGVGSLGSSPNTWRTITEHLSLPSIPAWDSPGFLGQQVLRM